MTTQGKKPIKIGDFEAFHDTFEWRSANAIIKDTDGSVVFQMNNIMVPKAWGQMGVDILAQKYFRKAGVPGEDYLLNNKQKEDNVPSWLSPTTPYDDSHDFTQNFESHAKQIFHRIAGCWTYWGYRYPESRYFADEAAAWEFYKEIFTDLYEQKAAPNSPQWFNTGLHWAYGITSPNDGGDYFAVDYKTEKVKRAEDLYEKPLIHACFLNQIKDNLVEKDGILDHLGKEARIFKLGAGSGTNYSGLRSRDERLSGGGQSSGAMSFLRLPDRSASTIKSGGTTRRAARMALLDVNHPEIMDFVNWKVREEYKVASLVTGSHVLFNTLSLLYEAESPEQENEVLRKCRDEGVPESYVAKVLDAKKEGRKLDLFKMTTDYQSEAYETVSGQNSNNSIVMTNKFIDKAFSQDGEDDLWNLTARKSGEVVNTVSARQLFDHISYAAWSSADPGLFLKTTINDWHTCPNDGEIDTTNPCAEYLFLKDTSCNLASLNLIKFFYAKKQGGKKSWVFDVEAFRAAVTRWTTVLDISVMCSQSPSHEIAKQTYNYRTLGLGYANLGGLLMTLGLPYHSEEGRSLAAMITSMMTGQAYMTSALLASKVGPFPRWEANRDAMLDVIRNHSVANAGDANFSERVHVKPKSQDMTWVERHFPEAREKTMDIWRHALHLGEQHGYRNAQTTLLAPTGTIALLMECDTTGVEPDFALVKYKKLAGRGLMKIVNERVEPSLETLGYTKKQVADIITYIDDEETIEGAPYIEEHHLSIFDCASKPANGRRFIPPEGHIHMMAAIQPFLSGAISKTINMPRESTIEDVKQIYALSHKLMLKSIAIYRDQSKLDQPLSAKAGGGPYARVGKSNNATDIGRLRARRRLNSRRTGYTQKARVGGNKVYLRTGEYEDGSLGEIFIDLGKEGTQTKAWAGAFAVALSIGLQYGVPLEEYYDAFTDMKFEPNGPVQEHPHIKMSQSIVDLIFKDLAISYLGREDLSHTKKLESLEEPAEFTENPTSADQSCPSCGSTDLRRTGTCKVCNICGEPIGGCA